MTVDGNLYGSSRDVGKITSRLPPLAKGGGRVNCVGFTRLEREGPTASFGMFFEFTDDSFRYDSDSELYGHLSRELVTGATQLAEAVLQNGLLPAAGVIACAAAATSDAMVAAEGPGAAISRNLSASGATSPRPVVPNPPGCPIFSKDGTFRRDRRVRRHTEYERPSEADQPSDRRGNCYGMAGAALWALVILPHTKSALRCTHSIERANGRTALQPAYLTYHLFERRR